MVFSDHYCFHSCCDGKLTKVLGSLNFHPLSQDAYLRFSNYTSKADKKYVIAYHNSKLTGDREATLLNMNVTFLTDVLIEQQRVKLSVNKDDSDDNFSLVVFSTPINTCKISKGVHATFFSRVLAENLFKSITHDFTCPFKKNVPLIFTDLLITDKFIPPSITLRKFKLEIKFFGIIKERKGWTYLYETLAYGTYKK